MTHRDRHLLDLARGQSCVMCGVNDGTVVAAHSNLQEHGKGTGHKADDCMTAWLCHRCHSELDQGNKMTKAERREYTLSAICKTTRELWNQGLIGVKK